MLLERYASMFGYIKPQIGELKVKEHELYKAVYCGLCRAQRKYTGRLSALFLSYDFVFLYLLRAELTRTPTAFKTRRASIIHPDRQNVALPNDELIFCACAAALLDRAKLEDDLRDEGFSRRLRARLLLPIARRAMKKARKKTSLPEKELSELLARQVETEKETCVSPDAAAECSGEIFALFSGYGVKDELTAFAAEKIGRSVGRWLYLTDAADDYDEDRKHKRFNPFLADGLRREDLLCALDSHAEQAEMTLRALPVFDPGYRALLLNVLTKGLHQTALAVTSNEENKEKHG